MSKFTDIQWLFFDIGSTLVDESKAYEHRIKDTIKNRDISYERFYNAMVDFAKQGLNAYNEAVRFFGLNRTPWHSEDEVLYPIGDRLDNDIIPAKQLGMQTIWVRQGFSGMADIKNAEIIADHTVESIGEILSYL